MNNEMNWIRQVFPSSSQERAEQAEKAEELDKGCEYNVKIQMLAGRLNPDLIAQKLIIRNLAYVGRRSSEERKYCQPKILQPPSDMKNICVHQAYGGNDYFRVAISYRIEHEPSYREDNYPRTYA